MQEIKEARKHPRRQVDCGLSISWRDEDGITRFMRARGVDWSESGARIEAEEPIDVQTLVHLRADEYGLAGSGAVKHCNRRGVKYVIGLELRETRKRGALQLPADFTDFYEVMQISPSAEVETVHRVYRMLVARYHPDNPETGDTEKFLLLSRAYDTLSHPDRRAAYDATYQVQQTKPLPVFELKEFIGGVDGEANRRLGILCLLYNRRRLSPEDPGLSVLEFERMMSFPREHLLFTFWFLKEKGYVRAENNGDFAVTAEGADYVEANMSSNRALYQLLRHEDGEAAPGRAKHSPAGCLTGAAGRAVQ